MEKQQVEWRPVPERMSAEHEVSSDGQIRRTVRANRKTIGAGGAQWKAGKILKPFPDGRGYPCVHLYGRQFAVHRIVCEVFHGSPEGGRTIVRHLNDNRLDNRAENLAWGTHQENWADAVSNGRAPVQPRRFDRAEAKALRDFLA